MAVLPDRMSLDEVGGPLSNYSDVVDPTTDEDAAWRNKYVANVAMGSHTITRAAVSFLGTTGGATQIASPDTGFVHDSNWGDAAGVKPVGSYVQTGVYCFGWATQVSDELGVNHDLNVRRAWAAVESSDGTFRHAEAKRTNTRQITVYTFEALANGTVFGSNLVGQVVTIFWL